MPPSATPTCPPTSPAARSAHGSGPISAARRGAGPVRAPACTEMHAGTVDVFRSSARFGLGTRDAGGGIRGAGCWWRPRSSRLVARPDSARQPATAILSCEPAIPPPPCPAPARQCLPTRIAISWPRTARATHHRTRGAEWPGAVAVWRSSSVSAAGWGQLAWVWRPTATARTHRTAAQGHPARLTRGASVQILAATMPSRAEMSVRAGVLDMVADTVPRRCTAPYTGLAHPPSGWLKNMPVGRVSARGRRQAMVRPRAARHRLPWRAPARPAPRARRAHHTASVSLPASVLHPTWSAAGLNRHCRSHRQHHTPLPPFPSPRVVPVDMCMFRARPRPTVP